ncbi:MAG: TlpA family protein disulfide reductase [Blautia sp.]|nr:TlpA family protein disulfide reductase [Blautia sp.]
MKRLMMCILTLVLSLGLFTAVQAEDGNKVYQLGDQIEDFDVTLFDGTEVSLYELLKEKKAVLINMWASWCGPCREEFPAMEEAYNEMQEDIGVLALTVEPTDTNEIIMAAREELGLKSLPMGLETNGLPDRFGVTILPTSVIVDRNGIICFIAEGAITDAQKFLRLFKAFTAEDYETTLLTDIPTEKYEGSWPDSEDMKAALCPELDVQFAETAEEGAFPFVPAEEGIAASNSSTPASTAVANFTLTTDENRKLGYSVKVNSREAFDRLAVNVDGETVCFYSGNMDWQEDYITLGAAGEHQISFVFNYNDGSNVEDVQALIKNLHFAEEEEAAAIDEAKNQYPVTLEGDKIYMEVLSDLQDVVYDDERILEQFGDAEKLRMVKDGKLTVRITVGPDVDVYQACVTDLAGNASVIGNLPRDEKGFLFTREDFSDQMHSAYGLESVEVRTSAIDENAKFGYAVFVLNEEVVLGNVNYLLDTIGVEEEQRDDSWHYEDNYYSREYALVE